MDLMLIVRFNFDRFKSIIRKQIFRKTTFEQVKLIQINGEPSI